MYRDRGVESIREPEDQPWGLRQFITRTATATCSASRLSCLPVHELEGRHAGATWKPSTSLLASWTSGAASTAVFRHCSKGV